MIKSISGTSAFEADLLKEMLAENKAAQAEAIQELEQIQSEVADEEEKIKHLAEQYKHINDWAQEFDKAPADARKMILARLIEMITITRGYHITIHFFITPEDFYGDFSGVDEEPQSAAI